MEKNHTLLQFDLWSDLQCRLFWIYEGNLRPQDRRRNFPGWPPGGWLMKKGAVRLEGPTGTDTASAGQWIFPANQPRWQEFSADAEIISIRFLIAWRSGSPLFENDRTVVFEAHPFPELETSARELLAIMKGRLDDPRTELRQSRESLETHFCVMQAFYRWGFQYVRSMASLGMKSTTPNEIDPRIDMATAWLRDRPFTELLRERELAHSCGLSVSQLNRLFVRYHGVTPLAFHEERRYKAAAAALSYSGQDIKSIAYELGFSSPGNFSTWFKRKGGTSPRAWRRQNISEAAYK